MAVAPASLRHQRNERRIWSMVDPEGGTHESITFDLLGMRAGNGFPLRRLRPRATRHHDEVFANCKFGNSLFGGSQRFRGYRAIHLVGPYRKAAVRSDIELHERSYLRHSLHFERAYGQV